MKKIINNNITESISLHGVMVAAEAANAGGSGGESLISDFFGKFMEWFGFSSTEDIIEELPDSNNQKEEQDKENSEVDDEVDF